MVLVGVVSTFGLNFQLTSAMMARVEFGQEAGAYGLLGSVLAVGSLTGALLAARRERPRLRLVIGAAFGFGVATGVQALMPTFWTYALASIPVGLASLTMLTAANAAIQTSVAPQLRGRVMALYMMVVLGTNPVGAPLVGWIGQTFGPRWSIGVGTITALAVSVAVAVWARRTWDVRVSLTWRRRPHLEIDYREPAAAVGPGDRAAVPVPV
jgi:MFS family permease